MEQLSKSIDKFIDESKTIDQIQKNELDEAAVKWAAFSLETFSGKLLRSALNISAALADFTCEYNKE